MQDEIVSKTKRKREMHDLQALGVALVALPESQLDGLSLDDNLHKAVLEAKRISAHDPRQARGDLRRLGAGERPAQAPRVAARAAAGRR
jgi:ribosome-associated protein